MSFFLLLHLGFEVYKKGRILTMAKFFFEKAHFFTPSFSDSLKRYSYLVMHLQSRIMLFSKLEQLCVHLIGNYFTFNITLTLAMSTLQILMIRRMDNQSCIKLDYSPNESLFKSTLVSVELFSHT